MVYATVVHTCNTGLAGESVCLDVLPHRVMLRMAEAVKLKVGISIEKLI